MRYVFECPGCGEHAEVVRSIKDGPPASVRCTSCDVEAQRVWQPPELVFRDNPLPYANGLCGRNIAEGVRTPAEQERLYGRVLNRWHRAARRKKRERGLSRIPDDDWSLRAKVPREAYEARRRQFGKDYWQQEGDRALKRDGWLIK